MRYIVLDLTDVRMVSSAGIRVIIAAFKALKKVNGEICFSTPNMSVSEVLRLTGLLKIINVYPDNIVAIRSFSV